MATAQWIGQWAWVIAPWFWVIMYDPEWFGSAEVATRTLAIWVGIIFMLCAMVPAIFIKSKSTLNEDYTPMTFKNIGGSLSKIFSGFAEAFKIKPFRKLCIATFLIYNAFNTVATFTFFIIVYHLFGGDAGASGIWPTLFGCIGALMTTFLVIPVVARMSKKLGKKRAFIVSQGISIIGYILLWFLLIPGKPYMFIFALPFFAFGIGSLFTLMMSMTADVIDLDELNTGKRREGIFGAIYWWMVKFGFAIAGLASGAILTYIGFDSSLAVQPDGAITGLRLFFSGLPIAGTAIAIAVMWNYDVTEEKALATSTELKARKGRKAPSAPSSKLAGFTTGWSPLRLPTDIDMTRTSIDEAKGQVTNILSDQLHGLCFGSYKEGQKAGDSVGPKQIEQRMNVIAKHTQWVRSFSTANGNDHIAKAAKNNGLKTIVGAWISSDLDQNEKEIENLISLGKQGLIDIAAVGNEVLLREDLSLDKLLGYIARVKKELPNVQVGYVDAYYLFIQQPQLVDACDIVLANCYPFWEGCDIENATAYLDHMYQITKDAANNKPVIVAETGWPSAGENTEAAIPSEENAIRYLINANQWAKAKNAELFYFSAFDETWKVQEEGPVGGNWGIWNKNEQLKYTKNV
jgi:GPH family glycoside/pentoside/hexuronide:cation symporter